MAERKTKRVQRKTVAATTVDGAYADGNIKSGLVDFPQSDRSKTVKPTGGQKLVVYKARGKYRVVDVPQQMNIEPSSVENRKEDEILNKSQRARLLDLTRNLVRNSSLFNTIIGQLSTNVVSNVGGKVVLSIPNEQTNNELKRLFHQYTRNVDFHNESTLNHLLKRTLREYVIGGDCVLMFDSGLVEDSGKVLFFESNEIVDVAPSVVEQHYGNGAWASHGKVYSPNGRHIGTIVSKSQTCQIGVADPNKCYFLKKDPNASPIDNYWYHFSTNWRDGRSVSQAASAISTIHQLEDLVQSELMASRRNSQIFCWLSQDKEPQQYIPTPFDSDQSVDDMTDEEIKSIVKEEAQEEQIVSFRKAIENSIVYEQLPEGFTAQQLTMNHPNQNVQTIVDWLANRCAASMGLSKTFATGNPTDVDYRANQLFSWPAITEFQKSLEQVLDWLFNQWTKWVQKKGMLKQYVAEDFMEHVDWEWRKIDDFDQVKEQQAIQMKLQNCTATYSEILGPDWKETLKQASYESDWMKKNGLVHPRDLMLSGGQTEQSKERVETTEEKVEDENKNEEVIEE